MKLNEVLRLTAFGTKIAVRKDGKVQHIAYEDLKDIAPLLPWANEEIQCFYVENNEFFIDLDKDI